MSSDHTFEADFQRAGQAALNAAASALGQGVSEEDLDLLVTAAKAMARQWPATARSQQRALQLHARPAALAGTPARLALVPVPANAARPNGTPSDREHDVYQDAA